MHKMLNFTTEERIALLLTILGKEATDAAMKTLNPTRAQFVAKLLKDFETDPPSREEVDFIVEDFNKYFSFAMSALGPQVEKQLAKKQGNVSDPPPEEEVAATSTNAPHVIEFPEVERSDDVIQDLNELKGFQIATALTDDHPKTIALVVRHLSTGLASQVIQQLSDENRNEVVVYLSQPSTVPDLIAQKVLVTAFEKSNSVRLKREEVEQSQVLADLMRTLPKDMRNDLIEKLTEADEELVKEIRSKLYVFDDLYRLDDRDIQKVLGETETDTLIVALQKAPQDLTDKLLGNLSKRARQTIKEEMQYKTGVSKQEIDEAREQLVAALAKLDEAGEITLS